MFQREHYFLRPSTLVDTRPISSFTHALHTTVPRPFGLPVRKRKLSNYVLRSILIYSI